MILAEPQPTFFHASLPITLHSLIAVSNQHNAQNQTHWPTWLRLLPQAILQSHNSQMSSMTSPNWNSKNSPTAQNLRNYHNHAHNQHNFQK